ncbi:hypothetical protein JB92DRAFT_2935179 [Gautieria morchelliformis]|nr:hypothetical protein JB92DRAFT_2935179 [Gautieria morchelliformis]
MGLTPVRRERCRMMLISLSTSLLLILSQLDMFLSPFIGSLSARGISLQRSPLWRISSSMCAANGGGKLGRGWHCQWQ